MADLEVGPTVVPHPRSSETRFKTRHGFAAGVAYYCLPSLS